MGGGTPLTHCHQPVEKEPLTEYEDKFVVIKEERMPDGKTKLILKNKETNAIIEKVI